MPSLKTFRQMSGLPDSIRRWKDAAEHVKAGQKALAEQALVSKRSLEAKTMDNSITVNWRAVASNAPSKTMPRSVPWVHGLIRDAAGPSPRIELAPKRRKGDHYPVHLIMVHPDQTAAEAMDWDASLDITVDGHTVSAQKSLGPAEGWIPGAVEVYALVAELDADHPLVVHAAEAAERPQALQDRAVTEFDIKALAWSDEHFPHPDFMNMMREVFREKWNFRLDYWPGDPLPDFDEVCREARDRLRA